MPRETLSQEMDQVIQKKHDFDPMMKIPMQTVWDWKKRVRRMEQTIAKLRADLKAAGKDVRDEDECAGPDDEHAGQQHGDHP